MWSSHTRRPPANADIVSLLAEAINKISITVKLHWIKAHQDSNNTMKKLSWSAEVNITADTIATNFLERCKFVALGRQECQCSIHYLPMQARLLIQNNCIHMATAEHMRQSSIKHRKNQEYFAAKHRKERALLVDWQSYCLHIQFSRGQHRQ